MLARALETIVQQSKRLTRLTEQLLDLSRLGAGKLELAREDVDVIALVEGIVATIQLSRPGSTVRLSSGTRACALADPLRLEQVVTNLMDNALKFSPRESPVDVEVDTDEAGWVRIAIRDYGIGIAEDKRQHVFERFFQAHGERHYGGMGIGLYVSRQIVEMHGGTIGLQQPEGEGSRFVVILPPAPCDGLEHETSSHAYP